MGLDSLAQGLITKVKTLATPTNVAIGVGSAAVLGAGTVGAIALTRRKKKKKSKKKNVYRRTKSRRKNKRYRKTPRTAGKGKDRSTKRIRYTKKGQPYRIMANGRARFIKKKGARLSHKRKGGRY